MINKHIQQLDKFKFNEKRLAYQQKSLETAGSEAISAIATILQASGKIINSGARLFNMGVDYTESSVKRLAEWVKDPGLPDQNLPEYDDLEKTFPDAPLSTGDDVIDDAVNYHLMLAHLQFKADQLVEFLKPVNTEFRLVEQEIEKRKNQRPFLQNQLSLTVEDIKKQESILKDTSKASLGYQIEQQKLISLWALKRQLEQELSHQAEWDHKPLYFSVEFPIGSGRYSYRFETDQSKKCLVNLTEYRKWLESYIRLYERNILRYEEEIGKIAYHQDYLYISRLEQLKSQNPGDINSIKLGYKKELDKINAQYNKLSDSINFPHRGSSVEIVGLTRFISESGDKKSPNSVDGDLLNGYSPPLSPVERRKKIGDILSP